MHTTVTRRIISDFQDNEGIERILPILAVAPMYMALAAVGMEIREKLKYDMWGMDVPHAAQSEGWNYFGKAFTRTGLLGISQMGLDIHAAESQGESFLIALFGPTISQLEDLIGLDYSSMNQILRQIPGFSQFTGARHLITQ